MLRLRVLFILLFIGVFAGNAQDIWAPDPPVLDSVSVDVSNVNGDVIIGWEPSDSADVEGYYIYTDSTVGGSVIWVIKDTVWGRLNTLYIDDNSSAGYFSVGYRIAAFDYSKNVSLMTDPHFTIYAFPYLEDQDCGKRVRLAWQHYVGWTSIEKYKVYRKADYDNNFVYVGEVPGSKREFIDTDLQDGVNYCYYVRAVSDTGTTAASNRPCILVDIPNVPEFIEIAAVSTIEKNKISITVLADETTDGTNYIVLYRKRAGEDDTKYKQVAKTTLKSGVREYNLTDNTADNVNYIYKAAVINPCGTKVLESEEAGNIVITLDFVDDLQFFLQWNSYVWWNGGVDSTVLYRQMDEYDPEPVKKEDISFNDFFDDLTTYDFRTRFYEGNFCYYAEFKQKEQSEHADKVYYSRSNKVCVTEFSRVFMPNAFVPYWVNDTVNSIFKPSALFIKKEGYYFAVYDRWGNRIFETSDPNRGWDGTLPSGKKANGGYYIYYLIYTDNNDEIHKRSGRFIAIE